MVRLCCVVHLKLGSLETGVQNSVPLKTWAQYHLGLSPQQILNARSLSCFLQPHLSDNTKQRCE